MFILVMDMFTHIIKTIVDVMINIVVVVMDTTIMNAFATM
jgi:hypothetical protein